MASRRSLPACRALVDFEEATSCIRRPISRRCGRHALDDEDARRVGAVAAWIRERTDAGRRNHHVLGAEAELSRRPAATASYSLPAGTVSNREAVGGTHDHFMLRHCSIRSSRPGTPTPDENAIT